MSTSTLRSSSNPFFQYTDTTGCFFILMIHLVFLQTSWSRSARRLNMRQIPNNHTCTTSHSPRKKCVWVIDSVCVYCRRRDTPRNFLTKMVDLCLSYSKYILVRYKWLNQHCDANKLEIIKSHFLIEFCYANTLYFSLASSFHFVLQCCRISLKNKYLWADALSFFPLSVQFIFWEGSRTRKIFLRYFYYHLWTPILFFFC